MLLGELKGLAMCNFDYNKMIFKQDRQADVTLFFYQNQLNDIYNVSTLLLSDRTTTERSILCSPSFLILLSIINR